MSFLTAFLNQRCTWWRKTGVDGFGEPTFAAPTVLTCRWEDRSGYIQDAEGNQVPSRSRVFLQDDIEVGDWLKLESKISSTNEANPQNEKYAYRVMDFRRIPSLDAEDFERTALL